jgi:hypothetical protein
LVCRYVNDLEEFQRTHQCQDLKNEYIYIYLNSEKCKHVDIREQTFSIEMYSLADSVGTKLSCRRRDERSVGLVSAKLITSIFAFSTRCRNSACRLSSAGESTNTAIHITAISFICSLHKTNA